MSDHYLNDHLAFCIIKPKLFVLMRDYCLGCKNAFSVVHVRWLLIFQIILHIQNIERSPVSVCEQKCLNLPRNANNRHCFFVPVNRSLLWHQRHLTTLATYRRCCWYASVNLIDINVSGQWEIRFSQWIELFVEMCRDLRENWLKC